MVAALGSLLAGDRTRLLTLTGPGGVGKTRLAIATAASVAADFADGVRFVSLASLSDPDLVPPTVAQILGFPEVGSGALVDRLAKLLRRKRLLMVLDNAEHLLPAAPFVAALLSACPGLTILVTSRARLNVTGEQVVPVAPLPLPDSGAGPAVDAIAGFAAVQLFVDRARAVDPEFALSAGNAAAVADICRRLDGLPLAIELAAARTAVLPPAALLARLDRRLPVLTGGPRNQPIRLRSLRDAVSWSYDLLGEDERALFRRLSVYSGGFTLEAAESIAGDGGDTLTTLTALVANSLISPHRGEDIPAEMPRFGVLETIREFGLEQLEASGEADLVRDRHAAYVLTLAERRSPNLPVPGDPEWVARLAPELDNVRLALSWLDGRDEPSLVRLVVALYELWVARGLYAEGRRWFSRVLDRRESIPPKVLGRALSYAGTLALFHGDYAAAKTLYAEELALERSSGDSYRLAEALIDAGLLAYRLGEFERAKTLTAEAAELARRGEGVVPASLPLAGQALSNLGDIALAQGDAAAAEDHYGEAVALLRASGYPWGLSEANTGLGMVALARGARREAAERLVEGMAIAWAQRNPLLAASAVLGIASLAAPAYPEQAARLVGAAEGMTGALGAPPIYPRDRPAYDRTLSALRVTIGETVLATLRAEGEVLSPGRAVDEAREMATRVTERVSGGSGAGPANPFALSERELAVLRLLSTGATDRQIGEALFIERNTASWHVKNLREKMGVANRSQAVALARSTGLI